VALDHERRAMEVAALEPEALRGGRGPRRGGFATAIWTNNARELTLPALERLGLAGELDLVVTRDDMRARQAGPRRWRVISSTSEVASPEAPAQLPLPHFGDPHDAVVVGDRGSTASPQPRRASRSRLRARQKTSTAGT